MENSLQSGGIMTHSFDEPVVVVCGVESFTEGNYVKRREFIYNIETMEKWNDLLEKYPHFGSTAYKIMLCIELDGKLYEWMEL